MGFLERFRRNEALPSVSGFSHLATLAAEVKAKRFDGKDIRQDLRGFYDQLQASGAVQNPQFYTDISGEGHGRIMQVLGEAIPTSYEGIDEFAQTPDHSLVVSYIARCISLKMKGILQHGVALDPDLDTVADKRLRKGVVDRMERDLSIPGRYLNRFKYELGLEARPSYTPYELPQKAKEPIESA